jgi:rod shape-determining protein MreC
MRDSGRRTWTLADFGIRLVILVLASLLLLALQLTGQLRPFKSLLTQATSPAQVGATGITSTLADGINFFVELGALRQHNAELEQINGSLRSENFRLSEVERENTELRKFFKFAQEQPGLTLRGAQIIGRNIGQESTNFLSIILIDLGQVHGIKVGMPVVTDRGLVGRISEVNNSTAKVLLIADVNSAVAALLNQSRAPGVIRGTPQGNLLMDFIPQGITIATGEVILTSGLGGGFPKGIPIGQVVRQIQSDNEIVQQAVVNPLVDFSSLELVAVVTNFTPVDTQLELTTSAPLTNTEVLTPSGIIAPTSGVTPTQPSGAGNGQ